MPAKVKPKRAPPGSETEPPDSGIGRAVAIAFAKEKADVAIVYFDEHEDAQETERLVREQGRECLLIAGDIGRESLCQKTVLATMKKFGLKFKRRNPATTSSLALQAYSCRLMISVLPCCSQ